MREIIKSKHNKTVELDNFEFDKNKVYVMKQYKLYGLLVVNKDGRYFFSGLRSPAYSGTNWNGRRNETDVKEFIRIFIDADESSVYEFNNFEEFSEWYLEDINK